MKTIAYYISEYGYGHASRSIAVIRKLLQLDREIKIIICHSYALSFIKQSLSTYSDRIIFHEVVTDVGYRLQTGTIIADIPGMENALRVYLEKLPGKITQEASFLEKQRAELIISDISPIAFEVAALLKIPSIGISNFTWYTAFKTLVPDFVLQHLETMYQKMDYFFSLAGSIERNWGNNGNKSFGFFSREVQTTEVARLIQKLNPDGKKKIIFVPIGMRIDIGNISDFPVWNEQDCLFVVSSNMQITHPNVKKIPDHYTEVQNYAAVSDLVITKAGWGTVSEAVNNGTPLFIIDREGMNEDQHTINYLKEKNLCTTISFEEFTEADFSKAWKRRPKCHNEANEIAAEILTILRMKGSELNLTGR
ncbi:hypothetical protein J9303_18385 [Bacillaceae bacterium Marseille-Q3522]|nr:hypothetical protein [Bacillaceae bacterium Marseille-Q3522]